MALHWINNVDLAPVTRRTIANARVGTEYRLVNDAGESLGFVVRAQHYWLAFDPWFERVGDNFEALDRARQVLIRNNYQGRAD